MFRKYILMDMEMRGKDWFVLVLMPFILYGVVFVFVNTYTLLALLMGQEVVPMPLWHWWVQYLL